MPKWIDKDGNIEICKESLLAVSRFLNNSLVQNMDRINKCEVKEFCDVENVLVRLAFGKYKIKDV